MGCPKAGGGSDKTAVLGQVKGNTSLWSFTDELKPVIADFEEKILT